MARINPNTNRISRLSLLEAGTRVPNEEEEEETNPLGVINTLLALREPKDLIGWLGSNTEENSTKLIKFIVAVRDEYDELVVDYNQLQNKRDNTREVENQGVIRYLQGQVADLTAENDTLLRLQEQAIVDNAPTADPPGNNRTSGTMDHEPSPGPSATSANTSTPTKRHFKLQDPPVFTDGKKGLPVEYWLAKMKAKMKADGDLMDTPERRMAYVINRVEGMAFGHLEPRSRDNAIEPWKDSDEMLTYLERVFGNSNRQRNAENDYQNLRQGSKDFNTFWGEFQRLAVELDRTQATLISDLSSKLSLDMQLYMVNGDEEPTDLLKYAAQCERVYQKLKDIACVTAAVERSKEKRASNNTLAAKKVATSTSTTTTRSTSSPAEPSRRLTISKRDRLMKEARCFTCKQVGHQTTECSNNWKPMSSLASVSRMVVQELDAEPAENAVPLSKL